MDANEVLASISKQSKETLKALSVHKDIDLTLDIGNLLADDVNPLNETSLRFVQIDCLMAVYYSFYSLTHSILCQQLELCMLIY